MQCAVRVYLAEELRDSQQHQAKHEQQRAADSLPYLRAPLVVQDEVRVHRRQSDRAAELHGGTFNGGGYAGFVVLFFLVLMRRRSTFVLVTCERPAWTAARLEQAQKLGPTVSEIAQVREDLYFRLAVVRVEVRRCATGARTSRFWPRTFCATSAPSRRRC